MIKCTAQGGHPPGFHLAINDPWLLFNRAKGQDPRLAGVDDRGGRIDTQWPDAGDRNRAVGEFWRLRLAVPCTLGEVLDGLGHFELVELLRVFNIRYQQTARGGS